MRLAVLIFTWLVLSPLYVHGQGISGYMPPDTAIRLTLSDAIVTGSNAEYLELTAEQKEAIQALHHAFVRQIEAGFRPLQ